MSQLTPGTEYTNTAPGNQVTATNLDALVGSATALAGIILDQNALGRATAEADSVLLADNTLDDTHPPVKVTLGNLLPETVRNQSHNFIAATGTSTAYAVTLNPAATAYTAGMVVRFQANNACGAAPTVNVNGIGALAIVNAANVALSANDILSGQIVELVYQAGNNNFQMTAANIVTPPMLSDAARLGVPTYQATDTGTAGAYAIALSPAPTTIAAGATVRFIAAHTNNAGVTLNVNGLGASAIVSQNGSAIPAGAILSGQLVEALYDGANWRVITTQTSRFTSASTVLPTAGTTMTPIAHGLGAKPNVLNAVLQCITTDAGTGYTAGQVLDPRQCYVYVNNFSSPYTIPAFAIYADATNIYCAVAAGTGALCIANASTGTYSTVTSATHFQLLFTAAL